MILKGTHNSMSYLPPEKWWMWLLRPFARCQRKTLAEQVKAGMQVYDLRIYRDKKWKAWEFAHGLVSFRGADLIDVLSRLPEDAIIRLILERSSGEDDEEAFVELCRALEHLCRGTFIGGRRKKGWKLLYDFAANAKYDNDIHQWVGSMAQDARMYERILPWAYARRLRKRGRLPEKYGINLYDFV